VEMAAMLRDLTAKKEKITEGKRDLEIRVDKLKSRLRSERLVVLVLFVICIVCAGAYLFYTNKKQKPESTQYHKETQPSDSPSAVNEGKDNKQPENTPRPRETQPSDSPNAVNGGKDNKQPENTPKGDK